MPSSPAGAVLVGGKDGVVVGASPWLRIGMHRSGDQARHGVQKAVLGVDGDLVSLDGGGIGVHDDVAFGTQLVTGPPQPDPAGPEHSGSATKDLFSLLDHGRVDGVHEPPVDLTGGLPEHRGSPP
jgi:hypothetical protein